MKSENFKSKFILVDSTDLKRPTYNMTREMVFNDFENFYHITGEETIDNIFELYNIPKKYRKVIMKVNKKLPHKTVCKDFITDIEYNVEFKANDDSKFIFGYIPNVYNYKNLIFNTNYDVVPYYEVVYFYKNLKKDGLFKKYISIISEFYSENINKINISKYNAIMRYYKDGLYGRKNLTLDEILKQANEKDLIKDMSIIELQDMMDKSSGITKKIFIEELNNRINNNPKTKIKSIKTSKDIK